MNITSIKGFVICDQCGEKVNYSCEFSEGVNIYQVVNHLQEQGDIVFNYSGHESLDVHESFCKKCGTCRVCGGKGKLIPQRDKDVICLNCWKKTDEYKERMKKARRMRELRLNAASIT